MNKFLVLTFALCLLVALGCASPEPVAPRYGPLPKLEGDAETSTKLKKHLSGRKDEKQVDNTMKQFYALLAKVKEVC